MTRLRRLLLLGLFVALGGCAQNAVFELTIELPPRGASATSPQWAFVQARANFTDFDITWAGNMELDAFPLTDAVQTVHVSVVTSDGAIVADPLAIKISFCVSSTCMGSSADGTPPEARFLVARAFYIGHRTAYAISVPTLPTDPAPAPVMIDKCSVIGCRDGTTTSYCTMGTTHFCEE